MADAAYWNNGDQPKVFINWQTFLDQGIPAGWQAGVADAVMNAYTRWMMIAGVDCRPKFWNWTDRTAPADGEILITMNERHFNTTRAASTFTSWRKASIVIHRRNGADLSLWPWVTHNARPGELDMQAVLTHEFGHTFWLEDVADADRTMNGNYDYQRQRFGPYDGDVLALKAIFRDMDRNRVRQFRSLDGGTSWAVQNNQLTSHSLYQTRTCLTPGTTPIGTSGRHVIGWSMPNRVPTWLRGDGVNVFFDGWVAYGGERSHHGPAYASAPDGTLLWAWVHNDRNGTIRLVRSTDGASTFHWVGTPAGAQTGGTPALACTTVNGQRAWVLAWSHLDRGNHGITGDVRASVSFNDGATWSAPVGIGSYAAPWGQFAYKSLAGVAAAAAPDNRVMLAIAWAAPSETSMNLIRSFSCAIDQGSLALRSIGYSGDRTRVQPALAYHQPSDQFVLAFREQNFLTSLRITSKDWAKQDWPSGRQIPSSTTHTGPALGYGPVQRDLLLWYGAE
ncbi:sialidase family protein [Bailinhaonella thermotolerans]|uniref:Exo-alpha-sialidase n=1 Tax=Bailinhaonella thermotolerans TaxID=1070861 RepID=A0A3A4A5B2_9ACTN|nr:sialidase family protein [Bailinhaonella thermotolerans]RJL23071.1 exo-alpha-sialidase [Bailinhaonella thermotolerans]